MANRPLYGKNQTTGKTIRATISFLDSHYYQLEKIAEENKVSVAWVVRDAVENYLTSVENKGDK